MRMEERRPHFLPKLPTPQRLLASTQAVSTSHPVPHFPFPLPQLQTSPEKKQEEYKPSSPSSTLSKAWGGMVSGSPEGVLVRDLLSDFSRKNKLCFISNPRRRDRGYWSVYMLCTVLNCFSHVRLFATLWTIACQVPLSSGFCSQEY